MMKRWLTLFALAVLALPGFAAPARSHYVEITIAAAYVDDDSIDVIPVLFSKGDTTFWDEVQADGDDVVFTDSTGETVLPHYIPPGAFTDAGTTGTGFAYVNVSGIPSTSSDEVFRCYFGDDTATSTSDGAAVFSGTGYVRVYLPGMTTANIANPGTGDLTAWNSPGTTASGFEAINAATYNGSNQYHSNASPGVSNWPISIEVIGSFDTYSSNQEIASVSNSSTFPSYHRAYINTNPRLLALNQGASGSSGSPTAPTFLSDSTDYYMAVGRDSTTSYVQVANVDNSTQSVTLTAPTLNALTIGALQRGGSVSGYLDGEVTEVRVSNTLRSVDYVNTMRNAWAESGFLVWGSSSAVPAAGTETAWLPLLSWSGTGWSNPSSAAGNPSSAATYDIPGGEVGGALRGLNLNGGASAAMDGTITGISVRIIATGEDGSSRELKDSAIYLVKGGTTTGSNKADLVTQWHDTAKETRDYGGEGDLWGTTWTYEEIASEYFGVSMAFVSDGTNDALMSVYEVYVKIFYTPGAGSGGGGLASGFVAFF